MPISAQNHRRTKTHYIQSSDTYYINNLKQPVLNKHQTILCQRVVIGEIFFNNIQVFKTVAGVWVTAPVEHSIKNLYL
jgi:hypothetical protein